MAYALTDISGNYQGPHFLVHPGDSFTHIIVVTASVLHALNIVFLITTNNQSEHHTPKILKLGFGQNISESAEKMIETLRRENNHNHAS